MRSRLFLISSNLAQPHFTAAVSNLARGAARAAVVTTAEPKLKERNRNAVLARDTLLAVGMPAVEFFDLDTHPSAALATFDLVYLAGDNPYYLLQRVRETGADAVIEDIVEAGRPIIGSSAGALLLGRSLNIVPIFDTSVSDLGCKDTDALGLVPFTVLPHTNRWKARFADYTARIVAAAVLCRSDIWEITDDEGLLIDDDTVTRIGGTFPSSPVELSAQPAACPPRPKPTGSPRAKTDLVQHKTFHPPVLADRRIIVDVERRIEI